MNANLNGLPDLPRLSTSLGGPAPAWVGVAIAGLSLFVLTLVSLAILRRLLLRREQPVATVGGLRFFSTHLKQVTLNEELSVRQLDYFIANVSVAFPRMNLNEFMRGMRVDLVSHVEPVASRDGLTSPTKYTGLTRSPVWIEVLVTDGSKPVDLARTAFFYELFNAFIWQQYGYSVAIAESFLSESPAALKVVGDYDADGALTDNDLKLAKVQRRSLDAIFGETIAELRKLT